jgi:hypothetical protein
MAEGRFDEAIAILKQGAKANGKTLPPDSVLYEMVEKFKNKVKLQVPDKMLFIQSSIWYFLMSKLVKILKCRIFNNTKF